MSEDHPDSRGETATSRPPIRVAVDDLAFVQADAVLRPADEVLNPVTSAPSRLDHLAGNAFTQQRRTSLPFEVGAAVVTGGGDLAAPFVIHVVIRDDQSAVRPDVVRRALISAWQRAQDWHLVLLAAPLIGAGAGQLAVEEAATLLAETFIAAGDMARHGELCIVVEHERDREIVDAIVRRFA